MRWFVQYSMCHTIRFSASSPWKLLLCLDCLHMQAKLDETSWGEQECQHFALGCRLRRRCHHLYLQDRKPFICSCMSDWEKCCLYWVVARDNLANWWYCSLQIHQLLGISRTNKDAFRSYLGKSATTLAEIRQAFNTQVSTGVNFNYES